MQKYVGDRLPLFPLGGYRGDPTVLNCGPRLAQMGNRRRRLAPRDVQWYRANPWEASDGSDPSLVTDFNNDRYALPQLGPELITNGTFTDGTTGWTAATATLAVVAGAMQITATGSSFPQAVQSFPTTIGKTYYVTGLARKVSGGSNAAVALQSGTLVNSTPNLAISSAISAATLTAFTLSFVACGELSWIVLYQNNGSATIGDIIEFEDISVREVMLGDVSATELITNGAFPSNLDGWTNASTAPATVTHSSGGALFTISGANTPRLRQSITTVVGSRYTLICRQAAVAAGTNIFVSVGTTAGGVDVMASTAVGAVATAAWAVFSFTATATTTWINFSGSGTSTATLDDVSVREWTLRPTLRNATFSEVFTFTATSTTARTYVDFSGVMKNDLEANQPRFTWVNGKRQLVLENESTNILLNSATLSTQSVSVSATAHTLSFYGTGTITLSGASTAGPLVGTGVNNRVSLTFTPSAGTLTLTVSGTVTSAQLEAQSFASSYIPTSGSTLTRFIETCQFSPLALAVMQRVAGSVVVRGRMVNNNNAFNPRVLGFDATAALISFRQDTGQNVFWNGASSVTGPTAVNTNPYGAATSFDSSGTSVTSNGQTPNSGTPTRSTNTVYYLARCFSVGSGAPYGDGFYDNMAVYSVRVSTATLQALAVAA